MLTCVSFLLQCLSFLLCLAVIPLPGNLEAGPSGLLVCVRITTHLSQTTGLLLLAQLARPSQPEAPQKGTKSRPGHLRPMGEGKALQHCPTGLAHPLSIARHTVCIESLSHSTCYRLASKKMCAPCRILNMLGQVMKHL